jgi:hypothetical protein
MNFEAFGMRNDQASSSKSQTNPNAHVGMTQTALFRSLTTNVFGQRSVSNVFLFDIGICLMLVAWDLVLSRN